MTAYVLDGLRMSNILSAIRNQSCINVDSGIFQKNFKLSINARGIKDLDLHSGPMASDM